MLVTFSCPVHADITLFGDVAIRLLKLMGHSGTVPGALLAQDVPAARAKLEAAVSTTDETEQTEDDDNGEPAVSLRHRALPLIELLRDAEREQVDVLWK